MIIELSDVQKWILIRTCDTEKNWNVTVRDLRTCCSFRRHIALK